MASGAFGSHRSAVGISTGVSAALFTWAAWPLPSRPGSPVALLLALLAFVHLSTLLVALLHPQRLRQAWRASSWMSLAGGLLLLLAIALTARDMVQRFGSLGVGVASLLGVIALLVLLATAPFAVWGLRATRVANGSS